MKISKGKDINTISKEWDEICIRRQDAINEGKDISLTKVIIPAITKELQGKNYRRLLDVGCGTGFLTERLLKYSDICVGIDASKKSILAAQDCFKKEKLCFSNTTMKNYISDEKYDICISNMALMSDPDYRDTLKRINDILTEDGTFVITISHPCFWAKYWGIDTQEWFQYNKEIFIEHDFSISLEKSIGKATYIHRPLEQYYQSITQAGFVIEKCIELYPADTVPEGYKYDFPRFMLLNCLKKKKRSV